MRAETKDAIASKFLEHAVLHMFVRTLLFSAWFRVFVASLILLPVLCGLAFVRIWRVTPPAMKPAVRISGLDWLQAWSLGRTARRELSQGRIQDGLIAYNLALGNNPGDLATLRDFLRQISEKVEAPHFQLQALGRAFWLLRVTQTNLVDLELAATIFDKYGLSQHAINLLAPQKEHLTPPLQKILLLALFNDDRWDEFDLYWRALDHSTIVHDREVQLYRTAFLEGWSSPNWQQPAPLKIEDFLDDPQWRIIANRLRMRICEQLGQADLYWAALARLREWGKDRLTDHVRGWRLLAANDRRDEAVQRAKEYSVAPATGLETVQLVQSYSALGLRDSAKELLDHFALKFSFLDGLWVIYANLLIEGQEWDELRNLAQKMRLNDEVGERLSAYSYFLEGRAELAQHRSQNASRLFAEMNSWRIDSLDLALIMANSLRGLDQAEFARVLLASVEKLGQPHTAYWEASVAVAYAVKDAELLLRAASEALLLSPSSWTARNNHAAALVINRKDPSESIAETFQVLSQWPDNLPVRINHALALIQNARYDEADRLLAAIPAATLDESERSFYNLACFETLLHQRRFDLALLFSQQIDVRHLFSCQREHLAHLRELLPNAAEPQSNRVAAIQ